MELEDKELKEKALKYLNNLKTAFSTLIVKEYDKTLEIIDLARLYLKDAEYYFNRADYITSIACSSYAEGLLDSLRKQKLVDFNWPSKYTPRKTVLVGGVFDLIHLGHIYFLKKASEYGRLIVIVARDKTVIKEKKRSPILNEKQRLEIIKSIRYVDEAYLGSESFDIRNVLTTFKPDIIVFGPDQDKLLEKVKQTINELGLNTEVIKIKQKYNDTVPNSTSQIIEKIIKTFE